MWHVAHIPTSIHSLNFLAWFAKSIDSICLHVSESVFVFYLHQFMHRLFNVQWMQHKLMCCWWYSIWHRETDSCSDLFFRLLHSSIYLTDHPSIHLFILFSFSIPLFHFNSFSRCHCAFVMKIEFILFLYVSFKPLSECNLCRVIHMLQCYYSDGYFCFFSHSMLLMMMFIRVFACCRRHFVSCIAEAKLIFIRVYDFCCCCCVDATLVV